ncbi:MAG: phosphoribosylanthranilate isomerase [Syntrophobacteraceae bacterium]
MNSDEKINKETRCGPLFPQVKICGLTRVDEAIACAVLGADAIGCIFYPRSPRNVSEGLARDISNALPEAVCRVGVFVNEDFSFIMRKVERCGLMAVQLHGAEPPELIDKLIIEGITVIKNLYVNAEPGLASAESYRASAYLIEYAGGPLPGGNAMSWDWSMVAGFSIKHPTVLAGGLNPANVYDAIRACSPDAVDVCSGVEASPGRKDLEKVKSFFQAVMQTDPSRELRSIFRIR